MFERSTAHLTRIDITCLSGTRPVAVVLGRLPSRMLNIEDWHGLVACTRGRHKVADETT